MPEQKKTRKRGYLHENFRLFHLRDSRTQSMAYHYHEFDKLLLFLGGQVTYLVEGVSYFLQPWDLLLIQHNLIHRPQIDASVPYERMILWLGRDWLTMRSDPETPLSACFETARTRNFHLLRVAPERRLHYTRLFSELETALHSSAFGHVREADTLCQQLLIAVNRDSHQRPQVSDGTLCCRSDPKIDDILRYIGGHLSEPLSTDDLARRFFLSRHYLMHRFKAVTGCTIHRYILQKRLLLAGEHIRDGMPPSKAAEQTGFSDYSTFSRAFRNTFHVSPRAFAKGFADTEGDRS